jgi:hypothetical protein
MGGAHSNCGGQERCIKSFDWETREIEAIIIIITTTITIVL